MISDYAPPRRAIRGAAHQRRAPPVVLFPDDAPRRGGFRLLRRAAVAGTAALSLWYVWPQARAGFFLSERPAGRAAAPARARTPVPNLEPHAPPPEPERLAPPLPRRTRTPPAPRPRQSSPRPVTTAPRTAGDLAPIAPIDAPLVPGWLSISTSPWGLLYVDGRLVGNTPQINVVLTPGPRRLRIERAGFVPFDTTITVAAGSTVRLTRLALLPEDP